MQGLKRHDFHDPNMIKQKKYIVTSVTCQNELYWKWRFVSSAHQVIMYIKNSSKLQKHAKIEKH